MIKNNVVILIFLLLPVAFFGQTATGDIENYIGNIIDNSPGSSGDDYLEPTTTQLNTWNTIINFVLADNLVDARSNANTVNYKITEFTDTSISPNQVFYVLEEKSTQSNYWGTYVFSKTPTRNNLIIQSPHSKFDTNTGNQAIYCFKNTIAKAVFINGTHRCNSDSFSSCSGTTSVCGSSDAYRISDLAHTINSIFQKTTENLLTAISNSVFVQLHGFGKQPTDPYVIMSNGTRETPSTDYARLIKDALLEEDNTLTFELAHINTTWTRLIGFTNTQGRLINNSSDHCNTSATTTSGRFIHIEQEKSKLRDDENDWIKMSNALASVFSSTLNTEDFHLNNTISVSPNPTTGKVFINGKRVEQIEIYNLLGQKIGNQYNIGNKNPIFVDLSVFKSGVYFFRIKTDKRITLKKLIYL